MRVPYQYRVLLVAHYREAPAGPAEWVVIDVPGSGVDAGDFLKRMGVNPRYVELALVVVDDQGDVWKEAYFVDTERGPPALRSAWQHSHVDFLVALEAAIGFPLIPCQLKGWDDVIPE